jgi:hypothetical protein
VFLWMLSPGCGRTSPRAAVFAQTVGGACEDCPPCRQGGTWPLRVNRELAALLRRDGFASVADAVGVDAP